MGTLATLVVKIIGDASGFEKTAGGVASKAKNLGKGLTSAGKKATLGLTLPILAAGVASVSLASNYEENLSKVNVVFDENAKRVERWSKSTATAIGISQSQALESAGTFGNLFRAMDVIPSVATDMSIGLVDLAADLASFNDLDPEAVLLKLQSGLTGQAMPLRSLGVNLTAAGTELKAFELGLEDADGELSEAALLTARYAVIMEQTTLAQGDFARTSEGLANTQRQLKAELADMGVEMGQILLPIALALANNLRKLVDSFSSLSPATKKTIIVVAGLVAVVGPLLVILGSIVGAVGTLIPIFAAVLSPIGLLIVGIIALGVAIFVFRDDIIAGLTTAWNFITEIVDKVTGKFQELWANITGINWLELGKNVLQGIADGIRSGLASLGQAAADAGKAVWDGLVDFLQIGSPSALTHNTVGVPTGQGVIGGLIASINAGTNPVVQTFRELVGNLRRAAGAVAFAEREASGRKEGIGINLAGMRDQPEQTKQDVANRARVMRLFQAGQEDAFERNRPTAGGGQISGGEIVKDRSINITVHNPVAEPASETIPRELQKLAFLGVGT